ncbi:hypothetical protein [Burkholderia ubonensis]|uniref:hypothetical protein n=1 Tax=Burkholderia ubonensis TaxID=101571 RepID=UPI000AC787C1|nr:hypothetical protein [Burkholderia ubonensis]
MHRPSNVRAALTESTRLAAWLAETHEKTPANVNHSFITQTKKTLPDNVAMRRVPSISFSTRSWTGCLVPMQRTKRHMMSVGDFARNRETIIICQIFLSI